MTKAEDKSKGSKIRIIENSNNSIKAAVLFLIKKTVLRRKRLINKSPILKNRSELAKEYTLTPLIHILF